MGQFAGRELTATPAGRKFQGEVQIARAAGADLGGQVDRQSAIASPLTASAVRTPPFRTGTPSQTMTLAN